MHRTYGEPVPPAAPDRQTTLRFHPGSLGLDWMHCGATAKFIGDHFAGLWGQAEAATTEARHSINYVTNELMENAVKFRAPGLVELRASLADDVFELWLSNFIDAATASRFEALLERFAGRDPGDLLIEQIEANAMDPDADGSGLGFLTLMNDYGATLGWTFDQPDDDASIHVETYAALRLA